MRLQSGYGFFYRYWNNTGSGKDKEVEDSGEVLLTKKYD